jgi:mevalonate kinase
MVNEEQVFSKVILSGEHSVLRGGVAVVTPLKSHSLSYKINKADSFLLILKRFLLLKFLLRAHLKKRSHF